MAPLFLSAEELSRYLREVELPFRQKEEGLKSEDIIRYGSFVGSSIECHNSLYRAMDHGRSHIKKIEESGGSVKSGRVILAENLTGSKGRFVRSWHAPAGGLWGCVIHANTLTPRSTLLLSLAVGVAACEAIQEAGVKGASIRWVNDILFEDAKLAGFLVESFTGPSSGEVFHLIGFGININNCIFPEELQTIAASVKQITGKAVDLKAFSKSFIAKLVWNIGLLYYEESGRDNLFLNNEEEGFREHPTITRWKALSDSLGKKVQFGYDVVLKPQYIANVTGIGPDGGLQMELEDSSAITEHSGEIRYL